MTTGVHIVRKRLRTGIAWYVYAWRGGPQVHKHDGGNKPKLTPDLLKKVAAALETKTAPNEKTMRTLIRRWRSQNPDRPSSPEWEALAASTKRTWGSALDRIEEKWGDIPLAVFNDPRMKARVVAWRDSRADTARAADIGVTVLRALLRFGLLRGDVLINVAADIPNLYKGGQRAEIIWTEDELELFHIKAIELQRVAASDGLRLAAATGLRRADLVTLTWSHVSDMGIAKRASKRSRGRRHFASIMPTPQLSSLMDELRARPRKEGVDTVLVDQNGEPWSPDRLSKAVAEVRDNLEIVHIDDEDGTTRNKHLHDARGTFATRLMTLPDVSFTDQEIAMMMGWSAQQVSQIRHHYVDHRAIVVALAERLRRSAV